jgi:hypothetical protein
MRPAIKRALAALAAGVIGVCLLMAAASYFLERSAIRAATENGRYRDFHRVEGLDLDHQIRSSLPVGTKIALVTRYLTDQRIKFSVDAKTRSVSARASYLKGSSFIVEISEGFTFRFDDAGRLTSVESGETLTGP